ncbi:MAG: Rieske 2Fe-2S domain-containing protein [Rhodocyclaceae bacterium]|nr:Rieske 2Fe-2S domain-containing protein [Rhodocyclaceae bacterium]
MNRTDSPPERLAGEPPCATRRDTLRFCAGALVGMAAGLGQTAIAAEPARARPQPGDRLVAADAEGTPTPLRLADVSAEGKPLMAVPFDAATGTVRDGSRLNKLLLLRLDPAAMEPSASKHAIEGVIAFSAVCTHQGCNITEFNAEKGLLLCFCHFSQFRPAAGGERVAGPAPRRLPMLPLKLDGDVLVVADGFTSRPGATL